MIREWWAEYFWSRTYRAKAAFNRGLWLGIILGFILVSILSNLPKVL